MPTHGIPPITSHHLCVLWAGHRQCSCQHLHVQNTCTTTLTRPSTTAAAPSLESPDPPVGALPCATEGRGKGMLNAAAVTRAWHRTPLSARTAQAGRHTMLQYERVRTQVSFEMAQPTTATTSQQPSSSAEHQAWHGVESSSPAAPSYPIRLEGAHAASSTHMWPTVVCDDHRIVQALVAVLPQESPRAALR